MRNWGSWWNKTVRELGLEGRVLHLTSAGNIKAPHPTVDQARYNWFPGVASLAPDLADADGMPLTPLTNTLAIENVVAVGDFPYPGPRCLMAGSFRDGHLGAIGASVWSLTNANTTAGHKSGTSMATPQVAGLAAYMLAIRPELTPQQIATILRDTAIAVPAEESKVCSSETPAPVIQPYAALLALDRPAEGIVQMPVRLALLDIDENGTFTESDLTAFLAAWETAAGAADFGRGDLNNDRHTGGDGKRPFDLDANGRHDDRLEVPVAARERIFDEAALTDVAIACYYAYSSLYTGDEAARDLLLQPYREQGHCGKGTEVNVSASFPPIVVAGTPATFEITVLDLDGQPVPGLYVAVEVSGGTVGRSSGETDGGGKFRTQATINPGASSIAVTATVRDAPEGEVIDVVSRSATAAGLGTVTLLRRWDGLHDTALPRFGVWAQFGHAGKGPGFVFLDSDEDVPATQEDSPISRRVSSQAGRGPSTAPPRVRRRRALAPKRFGSSMAASWASFTARASVHALA